MYKKFGYMVYQQVMGYYSGEEDAYDMHKALPRDTNNASMKPRDPFEVHPRELVNP